jgi:hypothetical protein
MNLRVNRYTIDGHNLGSFPRDLQSGITIRWAVSERGLPVAQVRPLPSPGRAPDTMDVLVSVELDGSVADTLISFPSGKTVRMSFDDEVSTLFTAFAPDPVWALDGAGNILYGKNDDYRFGLYDEDGRLERMVTMPYERRPLVESDMRFLRETIGEFLAFHIPRFQFEQMVTGMRFAEFYPAYLRLRVGPYGSIWVQHILAPPDMTDEEREMFDFGGQRPQLFVGNPRIAVGAPDWDVFDEDGRYLGAVTIPARFDPVKFTGEHIYGVWRDELDVEYVSRLKIVMP